VKIFVDIYNHGTIAVVSGRWNVLACYDVILLL